MKIGKMFIINKVIRSISVVCFLAFVSCASTDADSKNYPEDSISEPVVSNDDSSPVEQEVIAEEPEIIPPSPEELYLEKLSGLSLSVVSIPEKTPKGTSFSSPFAVKITDGNDSPVKDVVIVAEYPSIKKDGELVYTTTELTPDDDGIAAFNPENCNFAAKSQVKFYPSANGFETEEINLKIAELTVSEDFLIQSDLATKGAVLFIWDYNELNKPTGNSYQMISSLQKKKIYNVGNAPVNDVSDIGRSKEYLYKANYEMIEDAFGYLICGTIKFTSPVEKKGDDYEANLEADIYALDMTNGEEIFKLNVSNTATGANWNKCVSKCKEELCDRIAEELSFGL
ncbi:MAG: hypothetical protein IKN54_02000 [Lachnospiraceae bacterium]|nr:hypothetical protein [Lachnospiraceae bacterium]